MLMDRTRQSRRSSLPSTTNAFPTRRLPTIGLRDASQEGQVELQETVRLRANKRDRDRDRDSSNRNKRKRGEGDRTTEESVGNEQYNDLQDAGLSRMLSPNTASSAYDQNHRRTFTTPPPWKMTHEMIGVTVPRKARSASVKRPHDSWVSATGGGVEEQSLQSAEAASPSSSNVSLRKKMKSIGTKTRLAKTSKSSSSTPEDIEIEIAELLYGLMTSKNQESSSQKLEEPSYPSMDVEKKLVPNNSTAESVRIESEQPAKVEKLSLESAKILGCHDANAAGRETGSSEGLKEDIEEDNLNSGAGCAVTAEGRSVSFIGEYPSCSKSKLDVDKQDSASTRA